MLSRISFWIVQNRLQNHEWQKIENFPIVETSEEARVTPLEIEKAAPISATIWRRRTSLFPKLQVPGIYSALKLHPRIHLHRPMRWQIHHFVLPTREK